MEVNDEDVLALRDWISLHPYLPQYRDDYFLRCIIIGSKGSLQQAKVRFDNWHKQMQQYPKLYQQPDILNSKESIEFNKHIAIYLFPEKTKKQYQVLASRIQTSNAKFFSYPLYIQRLAFAALVNIWDNNFGTGEVVLLFDVGNAQLPHWILTAQEMAALIAIANSSTPYRIKEIHFIQVPPAMELVINLIKKATTEKMRNRAHFHSSFHQLHKFFSKSDLPEDYGGTAPPISVMYEKYLERVKFHHDKAPIEAKNRAEEAKLRPKSDMPMADTFRKLEID